MFANLKNKLIEEVRASPSKFQQLAAQAQAAVSSSTSTTPSSSSESTGTTTTTNENFFSITEEDTPQNTPSHLPLSTNIRGRLTPLASNNGARTRRLSNSSIASDVSFRLPSYDAPATYHLQSDLESEFGSEFGDEVTSPNKLEVITKEKLFEAYKKSLERYNKYRCRYNDLVKQYKELERDSTKARSVLMETQEKALRRINELREQCSLEQGAKAHLEQALRIEMDDMKCKLHAYETKLKLLGKDPESIQILSNENLNEPLIDLQNDTQTTAVVNGSTSNNNELISLDETQNFNFKLKITELENEILTSDDKLKELKEKYENCIAENMQLRKQEEENALLLAQTKQAIHTELEGKESEVKKLQEELKEMQAELENIKKLEPQLNDQSNEIKELREKLKQNTAAKQEVEAKLIAVEHMYSTLKQQNAMNDKNQQDIDEKIKDNEHKLQDLRQQNAQLNEMLQRYQQNEVSLAEIDNELNLTKNENVNLRATILDYERKMETLSDEFKEYKEITEKKFMETQQNLNGEKQRVAELQAQNQEMQKLQIEVQNLTDQNLVEEQEKLANLKVLHENQLHALREQLNSREKELKSSGNKVAKHKKHHETQQHKIKEQTDELEKLRDELNKHAEHLQALHIAAREREEQTEVEKAQLKSQITSIVQEISLMEEQMRILQQSHAELEAEKRQLELHIENMQRNSVSAESARLLEVEKKLQSMESENTQLAERNCLLEENVNRLEKLLAEKEREQNSEIELMSQLETKENSIQKLNEKLAQVLDENSHMQNAQELMDHDYRSLQNKYDALEKEKLMAEDSRNLLETELTYLRAERNEDKEKLQLQQANFEATSIEIAALRSQNKDLSTKCEEIMKNEIFKLNEKIEQEEYAKVELLEKIENVTKEKQFEIESLQTRLDELNKQSEDFERLKENVQLLKEEKENLLVELKATNEKLEEKTKLYEETKNKETNDDLKLNEQKLTEELNEKKKIVEEKTNEIEKLRDQMSKNTKERLEEHESLKQELSELIELEHRAVEQLEGQKEIQIRKIEELDQKLQTANEDIEKLHENNVAYQLQIEQIKVKNDLQVEELTTTLRRLQDEHSKLQEQIQSTNEKALQLNDYEQLKVENEYLKKHIEQCEERLKLHEKDIVIKTQEIEELKEKFKSLQCELYVLKENSLKHEAEIKSKEIELENTHRNISALKEQFETQNLELTRQSEHASYVTQQNDTIQKELLHTQQLLSEAEHKLQATVTELDGLKATTAESLQERNQQIETLKSECKQHEATIEELNQQISEKNIMEIERLEICKLNADPSSMNLPPTMEVNDIEVLRDQNTALERELEKLKHSKTAETKILHHEIEDLKRSAQESADRIMELESIRAGQLDSNGVSSEDVFLGVGSHPQFDTEQILKVNEDLESKLKEIMTEVQDVSNRNLFLEQQCENYLILEQSNERLKLQNAKLSRQLDETLVSMQHNENSSAHTEFEYLRNIMFQYLTGTANGNNETLVKVISAVLKFSPQQTQVALEKEHQRRSLINKIL